MVNNASINSSSKRATSAYCGAIEAIASVDRRILSLPLQAEEYIASAVEMFKKNINAEVDYKYGFTSDYYWGLNPLSRSWEYVLRISKCDKCPELVGYYILKDGHVSYNGRSERESIVDENGLSKLKYKYPETKTEDSGKTIYEYGELSNRITSINVEVDYKSQPQLFDGEIKSLVDKIYKAYIIRPCDKFFVGDELYHGYSYNHYMNSHASSGDFGFEGEHYRCGYTPLRMFSWNKPGHYDNYTTYGDHVSINCWKEHWNSQKYEDSYFTILKPNQFFIYGGSGWIDQYSEADAKKYLAEQKAIKADRKRRYDEALQAFENAGLNKGGRKLCIASLNAIAECKRKWDSKHFAITTRDIEYLKICKYNYINDYTVYADDLLLFIELMGIKPIGFRKVDKIKLESSISNFIDDSTLRKLKNK